MVSSPIRGAERGRSEPTQPCPCRESEGAERREPATPQKYAGGITSSALDGINAALRIAAQ